MATSVTIRRKVRAGQTDVPELAAFEGKDVEITVTEVDVSASTVPEPWPDNGPTDRYPLRGSVLRFDDPFGPAAPEEDWEALN
ncbi:MAG: hypothetical protein U0837_11000 [Dehalococcoidia bacterium]